MTTLIEKRAAPATSGIVLHRALSYDIFLWLISLGKESAYRERALDLVGLHPGESVLDIGCGTGTLAIAANRHVGAAGKVFGLDASPEMLARAERKARKAGVEVVFRNGAVEALPFPEGKFDVVLSTLMLHHLDRKVRHQCAREARRVLRPGGRILAVDFAKPEEGSKGVLDHFHHHGYVNLHDLELLMTEAGFNIIKSGALGIGGLHFVLASSRAALNGESKP